MFFKLRLKLTIYNSLIIGITLLLVSMVVVFGSPGLFEKTVQREMGYVAEKQVAKRTRFRNFNRHSHLKDYMVVEVDTIGNPRAITIPQNKINISQLELEALVERALGGRGNSGEIRFNQRGTFYYLLFHLGANGEKMLVFADKAAITIHFFYKVLSMISVSLLLVFCGSWFISGKALKPINKAWQRQMEFTADASHELRTPLSVIRTNLELVMDNQEQTVVSQDRWLMNIKIETDRLIRLVENLLTLARSDAHQQTMETSCFYLDEALMEIITPHQPLALSKNILLTTDFESKVEMVGDKNRFKQLTVILLDNAIKYTHDGGRIEILLHKKEKMVELVVSDSGIGIAKEHIPKIFDRFYRVDPARSHIGAGLGLAIAQWIVKEHGGTISAESVVDKGTRFIIKLPLRYDSLFTTCRCGK